MFYIAHDMGFITFFYWTNDNDKVYVDYLELSEQGKHNLAFYTCNIREAQGFTTFEAADLMAKTLGLGTEYYCILKS